MNYKITEPLLPGGLRRFASRSRVVDIPEGEAVPAGAMPTTDDVRDWEFDPLPTGAEGEN